MIKSATIAAAAIGGALLAGCSTSHTAPSTSTSRASASASASSTPGSQSMSIAETCHHFAYMAHQIQVSATPDSQAAMVRTVRGWASQASTLGNEAESQQLSSELRTLAADERTMADHVAALTWKQVSGSQEPDQIQADTSRLHTDLLDVSTDCQQSGSGQ